MKTNKPIVSVIIPTFNSANELLRSLTCLLDQTFKDFEVIVCDDGSKDNTKLIINKFKNTLDIHYYWYTNFGGPARPRNCGLKIAKGELIAFLDADDWWTSEKLEVSINFLEKMQVDVVYHDLWLIQDLKQPIKTKLKTRQLNIPVFKDLLLRGNTLLNSSVLVKKELIFKAGLLDENKAIIASEDYDLWIRISLHTNKFFKIPGCFGYYWYAGKENISKQRNPGIAGKIILDKHKMRLSKKEFNKCLAYLNYVNGMYHLYKKNKTIARVYFWKSIMSNDNLIRFKSFYRLLTVSF